MIAVIFEVLPADGCRQDYLDIAAGLRPLLDGIDGFVSIERFESLSEPGKLLSLSFWRDESAVTAWRRLEAHRVAQQEGRRRVFRDYRLRVAEVVRDYGMAERGQAPADSRYRLGDRDAGRAQFTPTSTTSNTSVAPGGMSPPAPRSP